MQRIIDVLNKKWSWILAFIPGVNLLYLIFWALTVWNKNRYISMWKTVLAVLPMLLLYRFLPPSLSWLATHLILSLVSFMIMRKCRGAYEPNIKTSSILPVIVALSLLLPAPTLLPVFWEGEKAYIHSVEALGALVQDDQEAWQSEIHPVYGKELLDMEAFKAELIREGIVLDEVFSTKNSPSPTVAPYNVKDGEASKTQFRVTMGEEEYRITAIYQTSDNGSGLIAFEIVDVFP